MWKLLALLMAWVFGPEWVVIPIVAFFVWIVLDPAIAEELSDFVGEQKED